MESSQNQSAGDAPARTTITDELIVQSMATVSCSALGIALGSLNGLGIFLVTNFLIVTEDIVLSAYAALLGQYFIGYTVTLAGSFVGLAYGFVSGFAVGWLMAFIRNFVIKIYIYMARYKERIASVNSFIDYP